MKQLDSRHLLAGLATTISTATVLVIATGLLRWRMSPLLAYTVLFASLAAGVAFALRAGPEIFGPRPIVGEPLPERRFLFVIGCVALAGYAFTIIPLWHRPDITWDAMSYHLPTIQLWAQRGYIHWVGSGDGLDLVWTKYFLDPLMNGYPKGAETLGFLLSYLTRGHLVNGWNFFYMPLGVLGIYVGAREFDTARAPALFGAALFAVVPVNVAQVTCAYVDTGYAAAFAGFLALVLIIVRRLLSGARVTWPVVIVAGELLGIALGIKPPATMATIVSLGILTLVVLFAAWKREKGRRMRFIGEQAGRLGVLLAMTVLVGGFWYARNWDYRGNPLFPVEVKVAGREIFPGTPLEVQITIDGVTPEHIKPWSTARQVANSWVQSGKLEFPPDTHIEHSPTGYAFNLGRIASEPAWPRSIRHQDSREGGLGFAWLGASLPAALIFVYALARRWRKTRAERDLADLVAFGAVAAIVVLCFLGSPLKWWARYTIWIEVPGFIALGVLLHRLHEPGEAAVKRQKLARWVILALSVMVGLEYTYSLKWSASQHYFVGPAHLHATLNPVSIYRAVTETEDGGCGAIFHYMPRGLVREAMCSASRVAISPVAIPHATLVGQLSSPPGARTLLLAPPPMGNDEALAKAYIEKHQPRYIIWDFGAIGPCPALEAMATRKEVAYGLLFMELGNDPNPPALLLPK